MRTKDWICASICMFNRLLGTWPKLQCECWDMAQLSRLVNALDRRLRNNHMLVARRLDFCIP